MSLSPVVDCHAHVDPKQLTHDQAGLHQVLARCERYAVKAVVFSLFYELAQADLEMAIEPILSAAAQHHEVRVGISFGICPPNEPISNSTLGPQMDQAEKLARKLADEGRVVGIGEVGLDYFWPLVEFLKDQGVAGWDEINCQIRDHRDSLLAEPWVRDCLATQAEVFRAAIRLASVAELPLIIHGRDAYADILEIMATAPLEARRVMLHCFGGSVDEALEAAGRGYRISIPSSVGYRKKFADVARQLDLLSMVIETDSPYHSPFIGHWNTAKKTSRKSVPPDCTSQTDRANWFRENQLEAFLQEVDRRYPQLAFEVQHENEACEVTAREYLSSDLQRRTNEPTFVRCAATEIAILSRIDEKDVCEGTTANACALYAALFP